MSDKFATGIDIPNLAEGSARSSSTGFIRIFARQDVLYGVLSDGSEVRIGPAPSQEKFFSFNNSAPEEKSDVTIEYHGILDISGSGALFHVTDTGEEGGNPLFANLERCGIYVTTDKPTGENDESPWAHVRSIANGGKSVLVQVKRSNTGGVLLGGVYRGNMNNDNNVRVRIHIVGERA